jgi:hypothetical protein
MSLKAVKEAVVQLHDTNPYRMKAMAEFAALEKAANNLPVPGVGQWSQPEWDEAILSILELMRSIAKDAE